MATEGSWGCEKNLWQDSKNSFLPSGTAGESLHHASISMGYHVISTSMIEAYKTMSHGCQDCPSIICTRFFFATLILDMDDIDLLFRAKFPSQRDVQFIENDTASHK